MKKTLTLLTFALLGLGTSSFAQALSQDFESTTPPALPSGWSQTSTGSGWKTGTNATLGSTYFPLPSHTKFIAVNDDADSTDNNVSDMLTTETFSLSGLSNAYLVYDQSYKGDQFETFKIEISSDGGTTWNTVQTMSGNTAYWWETKAVNLSAYNNMPNLKLRFFYSDGGNHWEYGVGLDNIRVYVPPTNEIALSNVTPVTGMPQSYGMTGSNITLGGTVTNNAITTVTSFNVNYILGSGSVVTNTISANIAPYTSATFTTPLTLPGNTGDYPVKVWVSLNGDSNPANDSGATAVTAVSYMPKKKMVVEEGTGTWCGWCVRGIVYMDSLQELYPGQFSPIAVHNGDPMTVSAYDSYMTSNFISGFPSVVIDRREVGDPGDLLSIYDQEHAYFGYADVYMDHPTISGNTINVPVNIMPAITLNGDYRLALVVEEDNVHGSGAGWDQHNYYSSQSQNQPLTGQGINYQTSPYDLPASQMYYNFVARSITPSTTGDAGVLPTTMNAWTNYYATLTANVNSSWSTANLRLVVMLIRNSDGMIMNSDVTRWPVGVSNVNSGITGVSVYPNPATNATNLTFSLDKTASVSITVYDVAGRAVYTVPATQMTQGAQKVTIPTTNLAAGTYYIKAQTDNGNMVEPFTVVK